MEQPKERKRHHGTTRQKEAEPVLTLTQPSRYGQAALANELEKLEQATRRHDSFMATGCALYELVYGGELDREVVEENLLSMGRILELAEGDLRKMLRNCDRRGARRPRSAQSHQERNAAILEIMAWWEGVAAAQWHGAAAETDLRIHAGLFLSACAARKLVVSESYRQVAELSGVSVGTVCKHLDSMLARGFVVLDSPGDRAKGTPTSWSLVRPNTPCAFGNSPPTASLGGLQGLFPFAHTPADPSSDDWNRWSGGWRTFCLLSVEEPRSVEELAETMGVHRTTAVRRLRRLQALKRARFDGEGWYAMPESCQVSPTFAHKLKRQIRHHRDRLRDAAWRTYRKSLADPQEKVYILRACRCETCRK